MEYRDQLKYIKSHQIAEDNKGRRKKDSSKKRKKEPSRQKITLMDRFLWMLLITSLWQHTWMLP